MIRKIENGFAVILVGILTVLPLTMKLLQQGFHVPVVGADTVQFNFVFMFACVAGIITWRDGKHLSLASIFDYAGEKVRNFVEVFRCVPTTMILTALFWTAFSQSFTAFLPDEKVWGIPILIFFAFLPLMYFSMLLMIIASKKHIVASLVGLVLGMLVSTGPFSGVLYFIFGADDTTLPFLYKITEIWQNISTAITGPLIVFFVFCAFLGVPLFICISAVAYVAFSPAGYVELLAMGVYDILIDKSIAAIPLFTIAGYILSQGSAGSRLLEVFKALFGWFRGGTVVAAVVVSTFFTTFTGVSGVTILALGSILTYVLCGTGFKDRNAQSLVTVSGAVGLLFPPSVAIIMYGTVNFFSVDVFDLFKTAILPGVMMMLGIMTIGFISDKATERPKFSGEAVLSAFKQALPEVLMPVLIILCFFTGFFSLLETASFAVAYAFCLETFVRKDYVLSLSSSAEKKSILQVIGDSIPVAGGVLIILGSARGLSSYLIDANIPQLISDFIVAHIHSKFLFLLMLNLCLLVVGCLMDIYSAILIVSPLIIPVAESFGIHPLQTAMIFLMNLQIGFLTPPVGMDLFIASYAFDTPVMKVVKGVLPYLAVEFAILMLITYVPFFTSFFI